MSEQGPDRTRIQRRLDHAPRGRAPRIARAELLEALQELVHLQGITRAGDDAHAADLGPGLRDPGAESRIRAAFSRVGSDPADEGESRHVLHRGGRQPDQVRVLGYVGHELHAETLEARAPLRTGAPLQLDQRQHVPRPRGRDREQKEAHEGQSQVDTHRRAARKPR